jgi:chemotaxis protein CheZ
MQEASMSEDNIDQELLSIATNLVKAIESGDSMAVDTRIAELTDLRESHLFQELGKLTREFHEALNTFRFDDKITSLAQEEIPDAKERLNYVITKTDEAANKTLDAVETVMPMCDKVEETVQGLSESWGKFTRRELKPAEFRELSKALQQFFADANDSIGSIRGHMNEVLMAQDFQDITGQIIKKVIVLVADVEKSLIELIKLGGASQQEMAKVNKEKSGDLEGPQIPGMEADSAVSGQDEVDDLLSSFGF